MTSTQETKTIDSKPITIELQGLVELDRHFRNIESIYGDAYSRLLDIENQLNEYLTDPNR